MYSGNVAGKPRGVLPLDTPASAFYYTHTIERLQGPFTGTQAGFWTIQLRASPAPTSKVLFEQSVLLGVTSVDGAGGLLNAWYVANLYTYKFKTRVCNGQFLSPVIEAHEAPHSALSPVTGQAPERPGVPRFYRVKVTAMTVKAPETLPARATSFSLQWSLNRYTGFTTFAQDLAVGEEVSVDVGAWGVTSSNREVAATERVWFRVLAVGAGGQSEGEAVRDTWNVAASDGKSMLAGYAGYTFLDWPRPTAFSEQSLLLNPGGGGPLVVRVDPEWVAPAFGYKCDLEPGAFLDIISDYWVGTLSNNDIYYSIGWKPAETGYDALMDARSGTIWAAYRDGDVLRCGRDLSDTSFALQKSGVALPDAEILEGAYVWKLLRSGAHLTLFASTANALFYCSSQEEGVTWSSPIDIISNVRLLSAVEIANGARVLLLAKTSAAIPQGTLPSGAVASNDIPEGAFIRVIVAVTGTEIKPISVDALDDQHQALGNKVVLLQHGDALRLIWSEEDKIRISYSANEGKTFVATTPVTSS